MEKKQATVKQKAPLYYDASTTPSTTIVIGSNVSPNFTKTV
jgi:hypothetical protein